MEGVSIEKKESRSGPAPAGGPVDAPGGVGADRRHPFWLWPNLLSLDAPLVAVVWQMLFAKASGVVMPVAAHVLLGVAVWVIYVSDRLLDAARLDLTRPATARHLFYRRHWRAFLASVLAIAALAGWGVLNYLPEALVARGFFLVLLVWGYFGCIAWMRRTGKIVIPKEILCGCLFAIGTNLAPAFYLSNHDLAGPGWIPGILVEGLAGFFEAAFSLPVFLFMGLCCMNCAMIAMWEKADDAGQDPAALSKVSQAMDVSFARSLLVLAGVSIFMLVREWGGPNSDIYSCVSVSVIVLWLIEKQTRQYSKPALRTLADVALLTPLVVLPFPA